ncbi:putative late blight resistance protein homolog R1A-4 [Andrographis paniculata]|uniref:putative late blight resistance protein homolog R1A-4 n=1 Tax=Andrographis paniculata TaxID=175694 RepID=UPI0021E6DBD4|nr:putative late blight resistance protein homolog R1A-4 [Andrographis paniculata]
MAYYAFLSAMDNLKRFLRSSDYFNLSPEIVSIYGELDSMRYLLSNYNRMKGRKLRVNPLLEQQIEDLAEEFADLIEPFLQTAASDNEDEDEVDEDSDPMEYFLQQSYEVKNPNTLSPESMDLLRQLISLLEKFSLEVQNMKEEKITDDGMVVSSRMICRCECEPVGLEEEIRLLMDWVVGGPEELLTMAVVGMAGIGKTTLVEQVYNHPSIQSIFDTKIMILVGPNFVENEFLQLLVDHIEGEGKHKKFTNMQELRMHLRGLMGIRRYLIVLEDVWSTRTWFSVDNYFPTGCKKSRIILTSRMLDMTYSVRFQRKCFLDEDDSWKLLHRIVFTSSEESCSFKLEKIGKKIAKNCEGLPLAIVSIGRLLRNVEKTVEYWKKVSEDGNPLGIGVDDNSYITRSLLLSYDMLHHYQKLCFLYAGVFPQSFVIFASELIRLWGMEGFNCAYRYDSCWVLNELISASVVLVQEYSSTTWTPKICRVHYVFRNLCISIAEKEKFCHVLNKYTYCFPRGTNHQPRLCTHNNVMLAIEEVRATMESISSIRSLLCLGPYRPYPMRIHLSFTLLKILNAPNIRFYTFPYQILNLVRLKYITITYNGEIPKSISKLQKLQVLIVDRHVIIKSLEDVCYLPVEIWNLKQLRHLQCSGFDLPDPCTDQTFLLHLKTLSGVSARSCTRGVLARLPKLKKLGIHIVLGQNEKENFSFFGDIADMNLDLSSLKCVVWGFHTQVISEFRTFPSSCKKIALSGCRLPWKCMKVFRGALHILKLRRNAFCGPMWEPVLGDFLNLEYLLLEDLDMEVWGANSRHFPTLKHLIIRHCYKLREIPIDFGNIRSLRTIEVEDCRPSVGTSAKKIQKNHQEQFVNKHLHVHIHSSWDDKKN